MFTQSLQFRLAKQFEPVERILRNLDDRIKELSRIQILRGRLIENVEVGTTDTAISHGLGRIPTGCIVVRSGDTGRFITPAFNLTRTELTLRSSVGATTVSLWVF